MPSVYRLTKYIKGDLLVGIDVESGLIEVT